ncbi:MULTISPECIES: LuxR C-terminal-related transcriptional regulator [unclassified Streptomyces]|uniref:helix-turn-helix transcriptional regulator n=1 Tax=unclassified Streptomyces TaxID=2593676 RepID=UPI0036EB11EC
MSTAQAPSLAPSVAELITKEAVEQLGVYISYGQALRLGEAAHAALLRAGWRITEAPGAQVPRIGPVLWEYDPTLLAGLARGHTPAEIAEATRTPVGTVKHRIERLRGRIGAHNTAHAVAIAYRNGWMRGLAPEPRGRIALSTRQRQILAYLADGLTNGAIAAELGLAHGTAIQYVRRLYTALGAVRPGGTPATSRPRAVALAYQHGLLPLPAAGALR